MSAEWGSPPFRDLQYCLRCCMPDTNEGISFDEFGVCKACQSSEQKIHIDWTLREKALRNILDKHRSQDGSNYDCIVPITGGKDSTFQLHVITQVYGLRPLAVTFSHNWYSKTGRREPRERASRPFDVDHIHVHAEPRAGQQARAPVAAQHRRLVLALPRRRRRLPAAGRGALERPADDLGRVDRRDLRPRLLLEPVRKFDREYFLKSRPRSTSTRWSPRT